MNRKKRATACAMLCLALMLCGAGGCSERPKEMTGAMATAIGLGHGNCITEVTVVLDGYGHPKKVQFDEIFPVSNVCNNTALGSAAPTVTVGDKSYYRYLRLGNKYFSVNESGIYVETGAATSPVADLAAYCKTEAGIQWYYDCFTAKAMYICAEAEDGTAAGDVKLKDVYAFNTANGSMRKRYSRYWSASGSGSIGQSSGLGFAGNMDMLENYLLAYGFDAVGKDGALVLPSKDNGVYNVIDGVTTGATLSADTGKYLAVAKAAYEKARAMIE